MGVGWTPTRRDGGLECIYTMYKVSSTASRLRLLGFKLVGDVVLILPGFGDVSTSLAENSTSIVGYDEGEAEHLLRMTAPRNQFVPHVRESDRCVCHRLAD